jgi:hypothetical protein
MASRPIFPLPAVTWSRKTMGQLEFHIWFEGIRGDSKHRPSPLPIEGWIDTFQDWPFQLVVFSEREVERDTPDELQNKIQAIEVNLTRDRADPWLWLAYDQRQGIPSSVLESRVGARWVRISMGQVYITNWEWLDNKHYRLTLASETKRLSHG